MPSVQRREVSRVTGVTTDGATVDGGGGTGDFRAMPSVASAAESFLSLIHI